MGLGIPPLKIKIMLESKPLKSIMLVRRLAVLAAGVSAKICHLLVKPNAKPFRVSVGEVKPNLKPFRVSDEGAQPLAKMLLSESTIARNTGNLHEIRPWRN